MKRITLLYLFIFLLFNGHAHPHKNEVVKVACIGNSITYGAGIKDRLKDSYPAQLGRMLGDDWEVRNFGVSGRTLLSKGDYPYIKEKAYQDALGWNPDIVIIKLGTNDSKPQNWKYSNEYESDYLKLIQSFQALSSKPEIYLCRAVPVFKTRWGINHEIVKNEINPLIKEIAHEQNLHLIDLYTPLIWKGKLFPDHIHPNAQGAGEMAKIIYKSLTGKDGKLVNQPFPGKKSEWKGFDRYDFKFEGKQAHVVVPSEPLKGNPWVWRARFPGWHTEMDEILLKEGFYVVHVNTANQFGSPDAMKTWDRFYNYLTKLHGFNSKVALEGVSRGGLFVYNWAKRHPERVNCIYAEAPVCDFKSWPGGFGKGKGSEEDWKRLKEEYGFKSDEEAKAYLNNPIDSLDKLAKAKVPVIHMIGLEDEVVPPVENTHVLVDRYVNLGGIATIVPCTEGEQKLYGHHFPIETPQIAADFIKYNTPLPKPLLDSKVYHRIRGGLENCRMKFEREKKGRVAFLGGSITYNGGWRDSICNYLQNRFPDTKFEFIAAGIPSMGTTPAAFRLVRDVLSKGPVDLLFEEAAVNDQSNGRTTKEQIRAMEGIVRHVRKDNPAADIVIMHFVDPDKMETYRSGGVPQVIINHEKIASHYNIPTINLAKEVTERIDAGEFTWEKDFKNLHPSPFGQQVYYRSMKKLLDNAWFGFVAEDDKISNHRMPVPIDKDNYGKGKLIPVQEAKLSKGWKDIGNLIPKIKFSNDWKVVDNWKPEDKKGTRTNYVNIPMLVGETPGKILKFQFEGKAVGLAVAAGPDAGIIEYNIDGSGWKKLDLFTRWSMHLHLPWYYTLATGLEYGKHTLKIRISKRKNDQSTGNACRIRYFYLNK